jgi:hypothetical protein
MESAYWRWLLVVTAALWRAIGLLWLLGVLLLAVLLLAVWLLLRRGTTAVIVLVGHVCVKRKFEAVSFDSNIRRKVRRCRRQRVSMRRIEKATIKVMDCVCR